MWKIIVLESTDQIVFEDFDDGVQKLRSAINDHQLKPDDIRVFSADGARAPIMKRRLLDAIRRSSK